MTFSRIKALNKRRKERKKRKKKKARNKEGGSLVLWLLS
jgi:hypothetical protein